ncbi:MAG: hypothetical protein FD125_829 [bacterium]|nr:MAG: hypothetical protein FD125_829 [bacterium]
MRRLLDFILNMEARRWRAALATALLLGATLGLLAIGKSQFGLAAEENLEAWLQGYRGSPWAFLATVVLFIAAAFIGAPQFILIAACVVAFGPSLGFAYSWTATVISAGVTYWLGRGPTARLVDRFGGRTMGRLKGSPAAPSASCPRPPWSPSSAGQWWRRPAGTASGPR